MGKIIRKYIRTDTREEMWERKWMAKYNLLEEHKRIFGHLNLLDIYSTWEHTLKFKGLRTWAGTQREFANKGELKSHRQQLLLELGFCFDPQLQYWIKQYNKLKEFFEQTGTSVISPVKYPELLSLRHWSLKQREHRDNLTPFQKEKLDEIGFDWRNFDERWESKINRIREFKEKYGHCDIPGNYNPKKHPPEFKKLIRTAQYLIERCQKGAIKDEHYEALVNMGFEFDREHRKWVRQLEKLIEYKKQYGDCNVPEHWNVNLALSLWVFKQRVRKDTLAPERRKILDEIGFIWDVPKYNFNKNLIKLITFKEKNGHINVPKNEDSSLYTWIFHVRKSLRVKAIINLNEEQIKRLNEIGFVWNVAENKWNNSIKKLEQFLQENNHMNVPAKYNKIPGLSSWVRWLRKNKNELSSEQIQKLDSMGFIW